MRAHCCQLVETTETAGIRASPTEYLHACPVCSCDDLAHYIRVPSLFNSGEFIRYELCASCEVVFRNPRLPGRYRLARYEQNVLNPEEKQVKPKAQLHYWHMMRFLRRLLPPGRGRRLLDFGCGAGGFLVEARAAGFQAVGLELCKDLAHHVEQTFRIPVFQGLVTDARFEKERFDVIVSSQVFEHLVDPRGTLTHLCSHLLPQGLILIEVPNLHDFRERLRPGSTMDDSHLFYFSAKSLSRMLRDAGLTVLQVHEGLRPYGVLGKRTQHVPVWLISGAEQLLSACQVKTVLSIIARAA